MKRRFEVGCKLLGHVDLILGRFAFLDLVPFYLVRGLCLLVVRVPFCLVVSLDLHNHLCTLALYVTGALGLHLY